MRLVALVLTPLLALGYLATQRIEIESHDASDAAALVDSVELQQTVAAILPPAQLERLALTGLAALDDLGVPRDFVVGLTGFDLASITSQNLVDLEDAFDGLNATYRTISLADGSLIGDRLGPIRGSLQAQRELSNQGRASVEDIDAVFAELDELLTEVLELRSSGTASSTVLSDRRSQLNALADVLVSAGYTAQSVTDNVIGVAETSVEELRLDAAHETYVSVYLRTLDDDERARFEEILMRTNPENVDLMGGRSTGASITSDPSAVRGAADSVVEQLDYLQALGDYSNGFHQRVASEVRIAADAANADARWTRVLLWAIALITVLMVLVVLWSILVPLRRLTRRASAISSGEIDLPPLPANGPTDIRSLTLTMNDLVSTLDRVNGRITSLASGEIDATAEDDSLPGAIGVSLRESFAHLANVTAQLQRSESLASAIVAQAEDAIWTTNAEGIVLTANEASSRLTGLQVSDQCGRGLRSILSRVDGEANVLTRSGVAPKVLVARSVIDVGDDSVVAVIAHDISERSRFEERLNYQALHDALTGLPNRFAVLEYLDEMSIEHPGQIGVLYMDLDGFKAVNDIRGHAVGDRVLTDVAERLRHKVRDGEFIGRLGGDEFVVVTHRFAQVADLIALGHRLIREVELPLEYDGTFFSLSASVGVSVPTAGTAALDMIGQADNAVYQAKLRGKGRVELFDAAMQQQMDSESELELALSEAVRNDELVLHLQPITDLRTNGVERAEGLVRWMRPGHGLIPPGDFIPIAERSSLILEIERWVLARVCRQLVVWRQRDPHCSYRISVNISGRHLSDGDLLADIDAVLSMTGADPNMLELELTETKLLEDMDRTKSVLNELRALGITIAIDDFGTGYSSMTYLRELPIDCLKIDRSFVAQATEHGYDSTVIEALFTIGNALDLVIVAEGVETEEQMDYLRSRGCQLAQGFLLARPMSIEDAEEYMFARSADRVRA